MRASRRCLLVVGGMILSMGANRAFAVTFTKSVIDFETSPSLPAQPSSFSMAGPAQVIDVPNIASVSGGVVLGNEINLSAADFATPPNVYATADFGVGDSAVVSIDVASGNPTNEVGGVVFNGFEADTPLTYTVAGFDGASQVATQTLTNIPSFSDMGFATFDLKAANLTRVTITPAIITQWDYSIDTLTFNQSIQEVINPSGPPSVPVPAAAWTGLSGLAGLVASRWIFKIRRGWALV